MRVVAAIESDIRVTCMSAERSKVLSFKTRMKASGMSIVLLDIAS